jgi:N-glycosylase/DNA lyase
VPDRNIKGLISNYKRKAPAIRKRLKEFRKLRGAKDRAIFEELCFCIFTPQTNAISCQKAVEELKRSGLLFKGSRRRTRERLKGLVRFHNKKAGYLLLARGLFARRKVGEIISALDNISAREWLINNVKGLGYKEASHFLRNVGLGSGLAILDVHILKNLKRYGVIKEIPSSVTGGAYLKIEDKMRHFARRTGIPMEEMDLLFWANETGFIFK